MQLSEVDYWKLRAAAAQPAVIEAEARQAAEGFKARIAAAHQHARTLLEQAGGDPAKAYRYNDATCELIEVQPVGA